MEDQTASKKVLTVGGSQSMWTESLLHERQENEARLNVMSVERRKGGKPCVKSPKACGVRNGGMRELRDVYRTRCCA